MTTRKITLTLPEQLIEVAQAAVAGGRARSVSAYVAAAAAAGETRLGLDEAIARWTMEAESTREHTRHAEQWARDFMAGNGREPAESGPDAGGRTG